MRLPVRLAVASGVFVLSVGIAGAQQRPELAGGDLSQAPPQITRIEPSAPQTTEAAPQPLGYESEVLCFGFIGSDDEKFIADVVGAENQAEQTDFTTPNLLYVDAGYDKGIQPGQEYWLVVPGDEVIHPLSGKPMGRFYQYRGRAVVICIQGRTSILRVNLACSDIPMRSYLKAYEPVPIPLGRKDKAAVACDPPTGKVTGKIVYARDGVVAIGGDTDVLIDLGVAQGIQPGDQLSIFRYAQGAEYGIRPEGAYWIYKPPTEGMEVPRTYLGDMAILYVGDRWAAARVIDSSRLIEVGDDVELK